MASYCIIGAGPSGLAVVKNFSEQGIDFDCFEQKGEVGGLWCFGKPNSAVYQSTHTISSKKLTEFTDFPMPETFPDFPHHSLVLQYLKSYAQHFGLNEKIEFNTGVQSVTRQTDEASREAHKNWKVVLTNGSVRYYRGLIIGNGHNWDPRLPNFQGDFSGEQLHSIDYKSPEIFKGKRVLIVGAGNTGCDIVVEASQNADQVFHSMRRGYHYLPKFFRGKPIDVCGERLLRWRFPLWLRRLASSLMIRIAFGSPEQTTMPVPDHRLFESHPIINSQLIYYVRHGDITLKRDIKKLSGRQVCFTDGTTEDIDLILYATGYKITVPFIAEEELNWRNGCPDLFLNIFHPTCDDLFFVGLIQPDSGQFGLGDLQAQLIARYLRDLDQPTRGVERLNKEKSQPQAEGTPAHGIRYLQTPRHLIEVEHYSYRKTLQRWIKRLR